MMPIPATTYPDKTCVICGVVFNRKRYGKRLEDRARYQARTHCSQACANTLPVVTKSAHHWRAKKHRKANCETCGLTQGLHVHHKDRDVTNDDTANLITLCSSCHLRLHWKEDRKKRTDGLRRRAPQECVICKVSFHPRKARTQTCSPPCMAALLSRRTTEHYAAARPSATTPPPYTDTNSL